MTIRKSKFIDEPAVCPKCQDSSILEYSYADTVDFRNLELDVEDLVGFYCKSCSFKWETPKQTELNQVKLKEEYAIARDKLRDRYGLLTADKIAEVRRKLTITQREAAVLFGGGSNAFNKYESGEVLQSFAMDRLIRLTGAIGEVAVGFLRNVDAPFEFPLASTMPQLLITIPNAGESSRFSISMDWKQHISDARLIQTPERIAINPSLEFACNRDIASNFQSVSINKSVDQYETI